MEKIYLRIAEHPFVVEGGKELELVRQVPGFAPFIVGEHPEEHPFEVRFGSSFDFEDAACRLIHEFDFKEDDIHCRFLSKGDTYFFSLTYSHASGQEVCVLKHEKGERLILATGTEHTTILRFALWFSVVLFFAPIKATMIHSSVIVHDNQAVLFLGESGTGKSTHTRLWLKYIPDAHLLNDDSPIVAIEEGRAHVYGAPWSGKTHCYHRLKFPLKAAVRLSQGPKNVMRPLSVLEAFSALQPSCPPSLAYDAYFSDCIIAMLSDMLQQTPVYHLSCLPDEGAAQLSRKTVFGLEN